MEIHSRTSLKFILVPSSRGRDTRGRVISSWKPYERFWPGKGALAQGRAYVQYQGAGCVICSGWELEHFIWANAIYAPREGKPPKGQTPSQVAHLGKLWVR